MKSPPNICILNRSSKSTDVNALALEYEKLFAAEDSIKRPLGMGNNRPSLGGRSASSPPSKKVERTNSHKKRSGSTKLNGSKKRVDFNMSLSDTLGSGTFGRGSRGRDSFGRDPFTPPKSLRSPEHRHSPPKKKQNDFFQKYTDRVATTRTKALPNVVEVLGQLKAVSKEAQDLREEVAKLKDINSDTDKVHQELAYTKQVLEQEKAKRVDTLAAAECRCRDTLMETQFIMWKMLLRQQPFPEVTEIGEASLSARLNVEECNELRRELARERARREYAEEAVLAKNDQPPPMIEQYHNEAAKRAEAERKLILLERQVAQQEALITQMRLRSNELPERTKVSMPVDKWDVGVQATDGVSQSPPRGPSFRELFTTRNEAMNRATVMRILKGVFSRYDPMKLDKVQTIMDDWRGHEVKLLDIVKQDYSLTDDHLNKYAVGVAEVVTPRLVGKGNAGLPRRPASPGRSSRPATPRSGTPTPSARSSRGTSSAVYSKPSRAVTRSRSCDVQSPKKGAPSKGISRQATPTRTAPFHRSSTTHVTKAAPPAVRNFPHKAPEIKLSKFMPERKPTPDPDTLAA